MIAYTKYSSLSPQSLSPFFPSFSLFSVYLYSFISLSLPLFIPLSLSPSLSLYLSLSLFLTPSLSLSLTLSLSSSLFFSFFSLLYSHLLYFSVLSKYIFSLPSLFLLHKSISLSLFK